MTEQVPIAITVSRETGEIIGVERGDVRDEDFRKILAALSDQMKEIMGCK